MRNLLEKLIYWILFIRYTNQFHDIELYQETLYWYQEKPMEDTSFNGFH